MESNDVISVVAKVDAILASGILVAATLLSMGMDKSLPRLGVLSMIIPGLFILFSMMFMLIDSFSDYRMEKASAEGRFIFDNSIKFDSLTISVGSTLFAIYTIVVAIMLYMHTLPL